MKKFLLLYNPLSGKSSDNLLLWIKKHYADQCRIIVLPKNAIREYIPGCIGKEKNVLVAGGDGTVSLVASSLVNTKKSLGIIPVGTGNLLAKYFKIPLQPKIALKKYLSGSAKRKLVDTFAVGERNFVLNLSVGKIAKVMKETSSKQKKYFGPFAYYVNALTPLAKVESTWFDLVVDGAKSKVKGEELIITNTMNAGLQQILFDKKISPFDGKGHVYVLRRKNFLDTLRILLHFSPLKLKQRKLVTSYEFKESLSIRCQRKLSVQGDGDIFSHTPVDIVLQKKSLSLLIPN